LLHPVVSGNKWYKLRLNVDYAKENNYTTLLTFGGGYSNHLVATAFAARMFGLKSIAIVRGKYPELTPTLRDCTEYGMKLIFVTKEDYNNNNEPEWLRELVDEFDELYIVPEGGANERGRLGAGLIQFHIGEQYTHVITAVGSGTTLAGLRNKLPAEQHMIGFAPFKNGAYLKDQINQHINEDKKTTWELISHDPFGGFGKWNDTLVDFMNDFYRENKIPLDIIYTAKMCFNLQQLLMDNYFSSCDNLLVIHSGGLQGNVSVRNKLIF